MRASPLVTYPSESFTLNFTSCPNGDVLFPLSQVVLTRPDLVAFIMKSQSAAAYFRVSFLHWYGHGMRHAQAHTITFQGWLMV